MKLGAEHFVAALDESTASSWLYGRPRFKARKGTYVFLTREEAADVLSWPAQSRAVDQNVFRLLWHIPRLRGRVPSTYNERSLVDDVDRGVFDPVWDWARGALEVMRSANPTKKSRKLPFTGFNGRWQAVKVNRVRDAFGAYCPVCEAVVASEEDPTIWHWNKSRWMHEEYVGHKTILFNWEEVGDE